MSRPPAMADALNANLFLRRGAMESDSEDSWSEDENGETRKKVKKPKAKPSGFGGNGFGGATMFGQATAPKPASENRTGPVKPSESFASRAAALQAKLMGVKSADDEPKPASPVLSSAPPPPMEPETGDWVEASDPSSGMTYYYNTATGETSWSKPEPPKPKPAAAQPPKLPSSASSGPAKSATSASFAARANALGNLFGGGASQSSSSSPPALPSSSFSSPAAVSKPPPKKEPKWFPQVDPTTGATYFYHVDTGETAWTNPDEEAAPPTPEPAKNNFPPSIPSSNASNGWGNHAAAAVDDPLPPPPPPEDIQSDWDTLIDPGSGAEYYYNRVTGVTQWEKPSDFGGPQPTSGAPAARMNGGSVAIDERSLIQGFSSMSSDFTHDRTQSISNTGPRTALMDQNSASTTRKHVRKLSVEYVSPRQSLSTKLAQFSIVDYGRYNFQKHSRGLFSSGDISVDELLSHTKQKLSTSLHKPSSDTFVDDSLQAFKNITGFMQDRPSGKDPHGHVIKLAVRGLKSEPEMKDEIFVQCVKQTTNNRNIESLERGWQLVALLCGLFAPSDRLLNYFYCYLIRGSQNNASKRICQYATLAMDNLDDTLRFGPRIQPPTLVEVSSVETLRPVVVNIETLDPQVTWPITCTAQTRVKDVYRTISQQLKIPFESDCLTNFSLFQTMLNKGRIISALALQDGSRILDVISFWNSALQEALKKNSAASIGFKFVFKIDFYLRSSVFGAPEIISHLYFMQGATDIIRGVYSPTEKESLWLAALILQARYGDAPATIVLEDVLPAPIVANIKEKNIPATVNEIEKLRVQFRGTSKSSAKDQFLGYVHQWKNYGLTCFPVRAVQPKHHKLDEIGINENGVFKIDPKTRMWWLMTSLDGILMYEAIDGAFRFVMGSQAKTEEVQVVVDYPEELKKLMHKYKLSTRMSTGGESKGRTLIPIQQKK